MSTGAASTLAWTGSMVTAVAGLSLLGAGLLGQARADTAADLSALAGADALAAGSGDPCAVAAEVASRNDAVLSSCERRDWDILVQVSTEAPGIGSVSATARAGPGPEDGGRDPGAAAAGQSQPSEVGPGEDGPG